MPLKCALKRAFEAAGRCFPPHLRHLHQLLQKIAKGKYKRRKNCLRLELIVAKTTTNNKKSYYLHQSAISVNDVSLAQLQEITL